MTSYVMQILIAIKEKKVKIGLIDSQKEMDFVEIVEERAISQKLLPKIDELLKRNGLTPKDIGEVQVESDQGENFTTTRIAETIAQIWKLDCA